VGSLADIRTKKIKLKKQKKKPMAKPEEGWNEVWSLIDDFRVFRILNRV